ncbi:MAG: hypothetical protein DIU62_000140 [Pseudomonadota bacterium]
MPHAHPQTHRTHPVRTTLHDGFLKLYRYRFETGNHDGSLHSFDWELMERGHSVGVLAYDPRRDVVVLGNEFRPAAMQDADRRVLVRAPLPGLHAASL